MTPRENTPTKQHIREFLASGEKGEILTQTETRDHTRNKYRKAIDESFLGQVACVERDDKLYLINMEHVR